VRGVLRHHRGQAQGLFLLELEAINHTRHLVGPVGRVVATVDGTHFRTAHHGPSVHQGVVVVGHVAVADTEGVRGDDRGAFKVQLRHDLQLAVIVVGLACGASARTGDVTTVVTNTGAVGEGVHGRDVDEFLLGLVGPVAKQSAGANTRSGASSRNELDIGLGGVEGFRKLDGVDEVFLHHPLEPAGVGPVNGLGNDIPNGQKTGLERGGHREGTEVQNPGVGGHVARVNARVSHCVLQTDKVKTSDGFRLWHRARR